MGYSLSWLACRGLPHQTVLSRLDLRASNQTVSYTGTATAMQALTDGWLLIVGKTSNHRIICPSSLAKLSADCEVVACAIEEHVMYASSEYWHSGKRIWRIEHANESAADNLVTEGDVPDFYPSIAAKYALKQASDSETDDYFEIPLECAKQLVGFKHDEPHPALMYDAFQNLVGISDKPKGWKRLIGLLSR